MLIKRYSPELVAAQWIKDGIKRMKAFLGIKNMTFDNDEDFSQNEKIAKDLNIKSYLTRPNTSQDKGTIDNKNGVIRLFFPKKQTLD